MSLSSDGGTVMTMPVQPAYQGGNGGFGWGGDWSSWIILFLIFGLFGGWGGYGGFGGGYSRDGGYSRHDAKDQMMAQMEELLGRASNERDRQAIQRCMEQMENE